MPGETNGYPALSAQGHYQYTRTRDFTQGEWTQITRATREMIARSSIPLADGSATPGSAPVISSEIVCFNGARPDHHEGFRLSRTLTRNAPSVQRGWTKTGGRPYGQLALGVLFVARQAAPGALTLHVSETDLTAGIWTPGRTEPQEANA